MKPVSSRRLLVVVNPGSRSGAQAIGLAGARLSSAGFDLVLSAPCSRHEVGPWIEAHAEGAQAIVVAGGDGSLNAVAEAVVKTKLPLGIIPAGTANDLARSLGLPLDMEEAADVIAAGHCKQIDVGDVNGHKFFNVASVGLSADLARELSGEIKRKFGRIGYALTAAGGERALLRRRHGGRTDCGNRRRPTGSLLARDRPRLETVSPRL